jgi:hypothetical protein
MMSAARALRDQRVPAPGSNPRSFLVRSTSVVLAPGESWVDGAKARVLVRAGDQLTLV